jgi:ABC-2 type transport system ATP-binding protein
VKNVLLQATGLVKRYGSRCVVNGIDLEVREKEVVAVIGPNGAGKSTTLDLILGLKRKDAGNITYWREDYKAQVGVQLQTAPFFPKLSALDNLKLFAALRKRKLSVEEGVQILERCGLREVVQTEAARLSGGQQKRLAIALALVHHPKLVFLDEPTAALDPRARREIRELIRRLADDGASVVFTSHDMEEVGKLADRIVLIRDGRVVAEGTPEDLLHRHEVENLEELYLKLTGEADA